MIHGSLLIFKNQELKSCYGYSGHVCKSCCLMDISIHKNCKVSISYLSWEDQVLQTEIFLSEWCKPGYEYSDYWEGKALKNLVSS